MAQQVYTGSGSKPSVPPHHEQMANALEHLRKSIFMLNALKIEINGDALENKKDIPPPSILGTSLSAMLEEAPKEIRSMADELVGIRESLKIMLFG